MKIRQLKNEEQESVEILIHPYFLKKSGGSDTKYDSRFSCIGYNMAYDTTSHSLEFHVVTL